MQNILQYIGKALVTVAIAIGGLFGGHAVAPTINQNVGATIPVTVAVFTTSLQSSISSSATAMTLVSGTNKAGNSLSGYVCFNIDEGTATEEFVCGTASGTSVTSMLRGIDPVDGDLEVTALKKAHRRGASVKVTDFPALAIVSRILNGDETLPNTLSYTSHPTFSSNTQLIDKKYADDLSFAGAPDSSTTVKGLVEQATQAEVDSKASSGGTTAPLVVIPSMLRSALTHDYVADAGSNDTYVIAPTPAVTSYTTGDIYSFKANTINTGTATLNVSGLGAKTIVKNYNVTLVDGDIKANQIAVVQYDGTNLQLLNPSKTATATLDVGTGASQLVQLDGSGKLPAVDGSALTNQTSALCAPVDTGSIIVSSNVDTTCTTNFTPKNITVYYKLNGKSSGTATYSVGDASFNGTSLVANRTFQKNSATPTTSFNYNNTTIDTSSVTVGDASGSHMQVTLTINSVSSTNYVIRVAFSTADSSGGQAQFYALATR